MKKLKILIMLLSVMILVGCSSGGGGDSGGEKVDSGIYFDISGVDYSAVSVDESELVSGARLLASQCAQCHGTYGVAVVGWPDLWGSGRQISKWMGDYNDISEYGDSMMYLHSGITYTIDEINLIKTYYDGVLYTPTGGE